MNEKINIIFNDDLKNFLLDRKSSTSADIEIIFISLLRTVSNEDFFCEYSNIRDFSVKISGSFFLFKETQKRLSCVSIRTSSKRSLIPIFDVLQLVDYYDSDGSIFKLCLEKLFTLFGNVHDRENIGKCLPLIISNIGENKTIELLRQHKFDLEDLQSTQSWINAVCEQPQFLIDYCADSFQNACRDAKSYQGLLALFLYDLLKRKDIRKDSIKNFFKLKNKYKERFIKAIRRYSSVIQQTKKENTHFHEFHCEISGQLDLIFCCLIGLKFNKNEFDLFFIKNSFHLGRQEIAFCFSNLNIFAKTQTLINQELKSKNLTPVSIPIDFNINSLFSSIVNSPTLPLNDVDYGKISIIITTKNPNFNLLHESINSILSQTYKNIEIVIIDDQSDDPEQFQKFLKNQEGNINILYYRSEKNNGTYISRNIAIDIATGDFIGFQDDDDISHPQRIEYQLEKIHKSGADVMTVSHIRFDKNAKLQIDYGTSVISDGPVTMILKRKVFDIIGKFKPFRSRGDVEFRERCKKATPKISIIHEETPLYFAYGSHQTLSSSFEYRQFSKLEFQRKIISMESI